MKAAPSFRLKLLPLPSQRIRLVLGPVERELQRVEVRDEVGLKGRAVGPAHEGERRVERDAAASGVFDDGADAVHGAFRAVRVAEALRGEALREEVLKFAQGLDDGRAVEGGAVALLEVCERLLAVGRVEGRVGVADPDVYPEAERVVAEVA